MLTYKFKNTIIIMEKCKNYQRHVMQFNAFYDVYTINTLHK